MTKKTNIVAEFTSEHGSEWIKAWEYCMKDPWLKAFFEPSEGKCVFRGKINDKKS